MSEPITSKHEDSDGTGYCRGCGTTIGEEHHNDCDVSVITLGAVAEYFGQDFSKAFPWEFIPEKRTEIAAFLRGQAETIKSLGEEIERLKKMYTVGVAKWQIRGEAAEAGEAKEISTRLKLGEELSKVKLERDAARSALEKFANFVQETAFSMKAPNPYTPLFVQMAISARCALKSEPNLTEGE